MDNIVVLTPNKKLVRLKVDNKYELDPGTIFYDILGMLRGFNVGSTRYIFIDRNDYLEDDREKKDLVVGFVKYDSYNQYISSEQSYYNYAFIIKPEQWFDSNLQTGQIGDIFRIRKLETSSVKTNNYTKYLVYNKSEFRITNLTIDFSDSLQYPPNNTSVSSPNYSINEYPDLSNSLQDTAQSHFFRKNLGSKINSLPASIEDASKKILYTGMIKICWRIENIYRDVLEKLAIRPLSEIFDIINQNIPSNTDIKTYINNLSILSSIDKVIARLLIDWGYRDYDNTLELFPILSGDQFYGGYYTPFNNYYNTLVNIYINIAYNKKEIDLFGADSNPNTWTPEFILKQSNLRLQYLVSIIPDDAINFLDLATKIKILKDFAKNSIYESREDAVIKIVRSIQVNEALAFLHALQNEKFIDGKKTITLFEKLYNKINDRIFLFGKNNRREFMNRLYSLWYVSTLNPYNGLNLNISNNSPTTTVNNYNTFYKDKITLLNYDSKKFFGFFVDNMNFDFNDKKITVFEEKEVGYTIVQGGEIAPDKEFVKIGDYDFYTAISLKEFKEGDTAVKLPAIALEGNAANRSYVIPIFYLKYMDDFGDNEDIWTGIGLTIDVALTFTGIGNLSKLRHLRHLSKIGRVILKDTTLLGSERILALEALSGAAAFVELTSSVASIILNYYTTGCQIYINGVENNINDSNEDGQIPNQPNNPNYNWCKNLDQFLFWVQIASSGTDFISQYMVRKSARKMLDEGIPNDFLSVTDVNGVKAYDIIMKFAGNLDEMKATFFHKIQNLIGSNTKLENDIVNLLTPAEQYQFIVDFGKSEVKVLQELNSNYSSSLVREWKEVKLELNKLKNDINYLKLYRNIKNSSEVNTEIFTGRVGKKLKADATPPYIFNHYKWLGKGVHHKNALQAEGLGGKGRIVAGTKTPVGPSNLGYYRAKVELHNPEFPNNGGWKVKESQKGMSTFFPDNWSKERLQQELAYAFKNKIHTGGNAWVGKMSDGVKVKLHINNGILESAYPIF